MARHPTAVKPAAVRTPRAVEDVAASLGLADVALERATGAPRIDGNAIRVLRDARENFPAWLEAIRSAERTIYVEQYIFSDDSVGREFGEVLAAKAKDGVVVRVLYDSLGTWYAQPLWNMLRAAGVEVLCFNPFRFEAPLEWFSRDHRKQVIVDGRVGYVSGLCISSRWNGDPRRRIEPWRDTGIEVVGPAVAALERAFAQSWLAAGDVAIPDEEILPADRMPRPGDTAVRVVAGLPYTAGLFRLDQVIASAARQYLWLTDAYFVGLAPYVQALCAAAQDGVDVRLLVPGASDIPALRPLSRAGYRPLLAGGVRVFEWNGSMLHAKSAVADGLWARIGSTNLNFASWMRNWELDVAIEDPKLADQVADMYEDDLKRSTEVVLTRHNRLSYVGGGRRRKRREDPRRPRAGSAARAAAGAMSVGSALGAALTNRRLLGPAEAGLLLYLSLLALGTAVVAVFWPRILAFPIGFIGAWLGLATLWRAWKLVRTAQSDRRAKRSKPVASEHPEPSAPAPPGQGGAGSG